MVQLESSKKFVELTWNDPQLKIRNARTLKAQGKYEMQN